MASYTITTKFTIRVDGEIFDAGLSVQITSYLPNPIGDTEKIQKAFLRVHGLDLKKGGYLNMGHLGWERN